MAKEQAIVFSLLKPGVDAHRVASHTEQDVMDVADSKMEMSIIKVIELVVESLPGTVIQMFAINSEQGDASVIPVLSLASSIGTSAFISTQMAYEWDSDKDKRVSGLSFYGYLKSNRIDACSALLAGSS
jgi:hypothetical protein